MQTQRACPAAPASRSGGMADAADSKSAVRKGVRVRLPPSALNTCGVAVALEHYTRKPSLGFSDCLVLEIARKAGHTPLGTFDKNLGKLEGAERL